jgi:A/G-specific adenine glycosylase
MIGSPAEFRRHLLRWYDTARRDLPWRVPKGARPDPYVVLVSESMLQQTQVATVIPYFQRFIREFPSVDSLAASDEQRVLRLWQGLGYYSRARNLRRAARQIIEEHGGVVPRALDELLRLPGVGRYTAGAIASLAYDVRAPILDGNVARVLCRIDAIRGDPRDRSVADRLWTRSEALLPPRRRAGDFNSALMELGATVCTPRSPRCLVCPVRAHCRALSEGLVDRIPPPRKARPVPACKRVVLVLKRHEADGGRGTSGVQFLVEQRPQQGRWAGMWQFVTVDPGDAADPVVRAVAALEAAVGALRDRRQVMHVTHQLTHRRYEFEVWSASVVYARPAARPRRWVTLEELSDLPLPRPHVLILQTLTGDVQTASTSG